MAENFTLDQMAALLAGMPSASFRSKLRTELERKTGMTTKASYVRPGLTALTPYLIVEGAAQFIEFAKQAFGATEILRMPGPDGRIMHAQIDIAGSAIEVADGNDRYPSRPAALHLYVPDSGEVYRRALATGAGSLYPLTAQPYGELEGSVKDSFGNHWYVGTYQQGMGYRHEGLTQDVTAYLHIEGAGRMIEFLKAAFGAREILIDRTPDGAVRHAKIRLGDSALEMSEAHGQWQPMPCGLHLYVEDCDAAFERAVAAGATPVSPPADQFYGDRAAEVADPFGNSWFIATFKGGVQS